MLTGISAITLATRDMTRAVAFYEALGFVLKYGGPAARFTSFRAGSGYLNLMSMPAEHVRGQWGRAIFYVDDVDAFYAQAVSAGLRPEFPPRDGSWGERYFHILDAEDTNSASQGQSNAACNQTVGKYAVLSSSVPAAHSEPQFADDQWAGLGDHLGHRSFGQPTRRRHFESPWRRKPLGSRHIHVASTASSSGRNCRLSQLDVTRPSARHRSRHMNLPRARYEK
jgi:catechol 2,3-dioxygenase-like lactoylglutathione lyase family enzyme